MLCPRGMRRPELGKAPRKGDCSSTELSVYHPGDV